MLLHTPTSTPTPDKVTSIDITIATIVMLIAIIALIIVFKNE